MAAGPVWRVYGASCTGAAHESAGRPYEDAWRVRPASADTSDQQIVTVAVSDGHGHARHFRSSRGAELAVELATTLGSQLAHEVRGLDDAERVEKALRERAGRDLVAGWRSAVTRDLAARPVTDEERSAAGLPSDSTIDEMVYAYGTTLILVVAGAGWLMSAQIGDGDLFAVAATGDIQALVSMDPRLDGSRTTSLCQPDAYDAMRFGVVRVDGSASGAVVLATDGYGNAQARSDWRVVFGADLAALAAKHGGAWISDRLSRWVTECASFNGSGDDATMVLMLINGTAWATPHTISASEPASGGYAPRLRAPVMFLGRRLGAVWAGGLLGAALAAVVLVVYALVR